MKIIKTVLKLLKITPSPFFLLIWFINFTVDFKSKIKEIFLTKIYKSTLVYRENIEYLRD